MLKCVTQDAFGLYLIMHIYLSVRKLNIYASNERASCNIKLMWYNPSFSNIHTHPYPMLKSTNFRNKNQSKYLSDAHSELISNLSVFRIDQNKCVMSRLFRDLIYIVSFESPVNFVSTLNVLDQFYAYFNFISYVCFESSISTAETTIHVTFQILVFNQVLLICFYSWCTFLSYALLSLLRKVAIFVYREATAKIWCRN